MKALRCFVLCLSVLSVLSGWSQSGCTISGACNYDPDAAVDDGSCVFENWYIPTDPFASDAEPAMFTCNPPAGYMPANDWTCMEQVLSFHPECELTDWDGTCHTFYCDCAGGSGCTDPEACNFNPTAECDDGSCIPYECNDPTACNYVIGAETSPCGTDFFCEYDVLYAPVSVSLGLPVVAGCEVPSGDYVLVENQSCILQLIAVDPYCIDNQFDQICLDAYCDCAERACLDPTACNYNPEGDGLCGDLSLCVYDYVFLPEDLSAGLPVVLDCTAPAGYYQAEDQPCAFEVYNNPNFYAGAWDQTAQDGYCLCTDTGGCTDPAACNYDPEALCDNGSCVLGDPLWYIPVNWRASSDLPAVSSCTPVEGYLPADCQWCVEIMFLTGGLSSEDWDQSQAELYCFTANEQGFTDIVEDCIGCTEAFACNYDPNHVFDDGLCLGVACGDPDASNYFPEFLDCIDNSTCVYETGWAIPDVISTGTPAVWVAAGTPVPPGYLIANNQACLQSIVDIDPYCVNTNWDFICQNAYDACAPPGCIDPTACNFDPDAGIFDGSCQYDPVWYLPTIPADDQNTPAQFTCGQPMNYTLAYSPDCVEQTLAVFPFAQYGNWTLEAQAYYAACAQLGCTDSSADNYDPDALFNDGSCTYTFWYLPATEGLGPAYAGTNAPPGYYLANQACMNAIGPPLECQYFDWFSCQNDYSCCINPGAIGCTNTAALNYSPTACIEDNTCIFAGCTDVNACNYDPTAHVDDGSCHTLELYMPEPPTGLSGIYACDPPSDHVAVSLPCFNAVVAQLPTCQTGWTSECAELYTCVCGGTAGCMDPLACNYDAQAVCEGTCTYPGCTYPDAENYDPTAGCDDQSCTFAAACAEDLNHDCEVGTPDLLQILGAFGVTCPDCD